MANNPIATLSLPIRMLVRGKRTLHSNGGITMYKITLSFRTYAVVTSFTYAVSKAKALSMLHNGALAEVTRTDRPARILVAFRNGERCDKSLSLPIGY